MKLDDYLKQGGVTEAQLAARVGCSQGTINKIRNGLANPTFGLLQKISDATDGAFAPSDYEVAGKDNRIASAGVASQGGATVASSRQ